MNIVKTILTIGLALAMMQSPAAPLDLMGGNGNDNNPLLQPSTLPFGAPDFSKIKVSDYQPAIVAAIQEQRDAVARIVANKKKPTFENTILAFEESGALLDRVTSIFYALVSADKTPEIAETQKNVTPLLTDLENEISFNKELFQRIKYVYDHQYKKLKGEDKKLLEETYKSFVRSGALLSDDKMAAFASYLAIRPPVLRERLVGRKVVGEDAYRGKDKH